MKSNAYNGSVTVSNKPTSEGPAGRASVSHTHPLLKDDGVIKARNIDINPETEPGSHSCNVLQGKKNLLTPQRGQKCKGKTMS